MNDYDIHEQDGAVYELVDSRRIAKDANLSSTPIFFVQHYALLPSDCLFLKMNKFIKEHSSGRSVDLNNEVRLRALVLDDFFQGTPNKSKPFYALIARREDEMLGLTTFAINSKIASIDKVVVDPSLRKDENVSSDTMAVSEVMARIILPLALTKGALQIESSPTSIAGKKSLERYGFTKRGDKYFLLFAALNIRQEDCIKKAEETDAEHFLRIKSLTDLAIDDFIERYESQKEAGKESSRQILR